jgi:CHASE2 domain-containing sensor protein
MPKIVLSYRHKDAAGMARLFFEELKARYGAASVFMDVDIPYGLNYRTHIEQVLRDCNILVAIIGPKWLGPRRARIKQAEDPVRLELETALKCNIEIIPVLVDGASMPTTAQLPDSLQDFHFRNAARVDAGPDFRAHVDSLIAQIDKDIGWPPAGAAPVAASVAPAQTTPAQSTPVQTTPAAAGPAGGTVASAGAPAVAPPPSPPVAPSVAPIDPAGTTAKPTPDPGIRRHFPSIPWSKVGRALAAIVLALLCSYFLSRFGALHRIEQMVLDWEMSSGHAAGDIAVVAISDFEYNNRFAATSPLDPKELRNLIDAIARSGPRAIGIDIDTSHAKFRDFKLDPAWPPIVWERDLLSQRSGAELEPTDILGGQDPALNAASGIPMLLDDAADKVTRLYTRCIETKAGPVPSFVFAAAVAFRDGSTRRIATLCKGQDKGLVQPFYISYATDWTAIPAEQVRFRSGLKANGGQEQSMPELKGKLVLLGGTFLDVDRHFTPIGTVPGVLVLANAIQTELSGEALAAYPRWGLLLLEFGVALVFFLIIRIWESSMSKTVVFGLLIGLALSCAASFVMFHSLARVTAFLPTLVALLIIEVIEHVRHRSLHHAAHAK